MKVIKVVTLAFVLGCIVKTAPVYGIMVTPSNVVLPTSPGELLSFDFIITDIGDLTSDAQGFQAIVSVSGPGVLTGDGASSLAVNSVADYWLFENSWTVFIDHGDNSYTFGDIPNDGIAQPLDNGDILARYAFTWDGTVGDYTFTLDLDTDYSFILLENFVSKEALQFNPGGYPGVGSSFTVTIPEPTTVCLLGLGALSLLRSSRRRREP